MPSANKTIGTEPAAGEDGVDMFNRAGVAKWQFVLKR